MPKHYQRISEQSDDEVESDIATSQVPAREPIPCSPPPSFHSQDSSPITSSRNSQHLPIDHEPRANNESRTLTETFGNDMSLDNVPDERQRLMRSGDNASIENDHNSRQPNQSVRISSNTSDRLPKFVSRINMFRTTVTGGFNGTANDGVFANLSAKPTRGGEADEKPPTYEQAAADATPPYWETTVLAHGIDSGDVFLDGLPVGSVFSFVWNAAVSMVFQLVGFLLTYLLHSTHAAKNGSKAGLGITLVQFAFGMKSHPPPDNNDNHNGVPKDPNLHDFDSGDVGSHTDDAKDSKGGGSGGFSADWMSYVVMVVGWFILIRAISEFLRARRHEQLALQSPEHVAAANALAAAASSEAETDDRV